MRAKGRPEPAAVRIRDPARAPSIELAVFNNREFRKSRAKMRRLLEALGALMSTSNRVSWIALAISFVAAVFAGLEWYDNHIARLDSHNQLVWSMKPSITFTTGDVDDKSVGVRLENAGPGIAVIKSISYFVDRRSLKDADEAVEQFDNVNTFDVDQGDPLAVGEKIWLLRHSAKTHGKKDEAELEKFEDMVKQSPCG